MALYPSPNLSEILPIVDYSPPPITTTPFPSSSPKSQPIANPNPPSPTNPSPLTTYPYLYLSPPPPPPPPPPLSISPPSPPPSLPISPPPLLSNSPPPSLSSYDSPPPTSSPPPLHPTSSPPPTSPSPSSPLPPTSSPPLTSPSPSPPLPPTSSPPPTSPSPPLPPTSSPPPTSPPPATAPSTTIPSQPPPTYREPPSSPPTLLPNSLSPPPPPPPHVPTTLRHLPPPSIASTLKSPNFTTKGRLASQHGNSTGDNGIASGATATIAVVAGFMMLAFVGTAIWFVRKRRKPVVFAGFAVPAPGPTPDPLARAVQSSGSYGHSYSPSDPGLGNPRSWFTYEDLSLFTDGFSAQNKLGEGGFGSVYKGLLQDGREVAVKQLKVGGSQGDREFKAEVEIISRVHHRHLVSLVGYCILEHHRLLVYDFVPNNTLYYHLHGNGTKVMDWATRVKVAAGAARGIAYLHEDCHPRIIHRDIKSSNILLDNNFEAQVSDFGLARLTADACTHVTTRVMGTFGYLAPEYASSGKLTTKSDVYSFGVVLLELVTGRKPVDISQPLGDESLVEWARPLLNRALENGDTRDLPDPRLERRYNQSEMFHMIEAAAACIRHSSAMRPTMGQVVRALDNLVELDITNGVRPGQSEVFDTGPNTEEIEMFQRRPFYSQDYCSGLQQ